MIFLDSEPNRRIQIRLLNEECHVVRELPDIVRVENKSVPAVADHVFGPSLIRAKEPACRTPSPREQPSR